MKRGQLTEYDIVVMGTLFSGPALSGYEIHTRSSSARRLIGSTTRNTSPTYKALQRLLGLGYVHRSAVVPKMKRRQHVFNLTVFGTSAFRRSVNDRALLYKELNLFTGRVI